MWAIRYEGKMTDKIPAWAFIQATEGALNPLCNSRLAHEYFKKKYGNKKIKVDLATIKEISSYGFYDVAIVSTWFTIGKDQYHTIQFIKMYISDIISSVNLRDFVIADSDHNIILENI